MSYLNQAMIARLEREERGVTLSVAHACEVIFGIPPRELFPALLESVESRVLARMYELHSRIKQEAPSQKATAKLELLQQAILRITALQESEV